MNEIIVIRTSDPYGSILASIMATLRGKNVQVFHTADLDSSVLALGDIEIMPEQWRGTKAGAEIHLIYGEFSILYCMVYCPGRVFRWEQLYNAAWKVFENEDSENVPLRYSGSVCALNESFQLCKNGEYLKKKI